MWEYVSKSPAGGICYYNSSRDICVMKYPGKFKVCSGRVLSRVKQPYGFEVCRVYNRRKHVVSVNTSMGSLHLC